MRRALILITAVVFCAVSAGLAMAAEKAAAEKPAAAAGGPKAPATPPKPLPRANFSMLYGSVTKVDSADPNSVKLEVKNEADGATHMVEVIPATNVTKVTEISEIKVGDNVRIMARKADNKEVAMGVMFGKIKKPAPRPAAPAAPAAMPKPMAETKKK
jgi:Cu/Ag efflux protein CusF